MKLGATAQEPDASITPRRRGRCPDLIQQSEVQCLQAQRSKILRGEILTLITCCVTRGINRRPKTRWVYENDQVGTATSWLYLLCRCGGLQRRFT